MIMMIQFLFNFDNMSEDDLVKKCGCLLNYPRHKARFWFQDGSESSGGRRHFAGGSSEARWWRH